MLKRLLNRVEYTKTEIYPVKCVQGKCSLHALALDYVSSLFTTNAKPISKILAGVIERPSA
jgi:hypothetical protein